MNLFERVKAILVTPKTEWQVIAREPGALGMLAKHRKSKGGRKRHEEAGTTGKQPDRRLA
jgi:hypothetical protein